MRIEVVLFDMGGTLEDVRFDRDSRLLALPAILAILRSKGISLEGDDETILDTILRRNAEYKAWSEKTKIELPAAEIWYSWNLKDFAVNKDVISILAERLAFAWEKTFFRRELRPDAIRTLEALRAMGYRCGVISNTSSRTQVFSTLREYGIARYFDCVILSSVEGVRKPDPRIFGAALNAVGTSPRKAAYVGDTLSRDVIGSKLAGYALSFQIRSFLTTPSDAQVEPGSVKPDFLISSLSEIPDALVRYEAGQGEKT